MNFLLLDNNGQSKQSVNARAVLKDYIGYKVSKKENAPLDLEMSVDTTNEMGSMDLYLGTTKTLAQLKATVVDTSNSNLSLATLQNRYQEFFRAIKEQLTVPRNNSFYWHFYASFFDEAIKNGYQDAFITMINFQDKKKDTDLTDWLKVQDNTKKLIDFTKWVEDYQRKP
jgi:hypothetical protein